MRIPTPLPESTGERLAKWWNERWDIKLWQVLVTLFALFLAYLLANAGGVLFIFAFVVIYFHFQEPINDGLSDLWRRKFWFWRS